MGRQPKPKETLEKSDLFLSRLTDDQIAIYAREVFRINQIVGRTVKSELQGMSNPILAGMITKIIIDVLNGKKIE